MRPKVCFDVEYAVEAEAEARLKRKATADREAKLRVAKVSKDDKQHKQPKGRSRRATGIMKVRNKRRKQSMKQEEEESRKRARKASLGVDNVEGTIVAAPHDGDFFWEVAAVIGRRIRRGRVEYLIRWKGCSEEENTWEPAANLCDSAMEEAIKYCKAEKLKAKNRAEDEKKLFGDATTETSTEEKEGTATIKVAIASTTNDEIDNNITNAAMKCDITTDDDGEEEENNLVVEDTTLNWNDADQVIFREVKRINVNDPGVAAIVKENRINGIPVVLVGHVGWANFAKRWLTEKKPEEKEEAKNSNASTAELSHKEATPSNVNGLDLDLSTEKYELDIAKMIKDIGDEDVPVIKRNYDEVKPIHGTIPAAKFLSECWPSSETEAELQESKKRAPKFYLHQWQFPLSDRAGGKLCHQNNPLDGIMGEDLLKYWLDLPQCKLDSPLQYIFMGTADTHSRLHKDPGGLEISIAPITGKKECVLVHRDDSHCLYHLTASLDAIDLQRFPLLSQARVYKTVIKPGEILLMPNGTYHQCRNLTPCLSYSRFHLDAVNLFPFVMSLFNGDAPEIEHRDVLWNVASALIKKVDEVVDLIQDRVLAYRNVTDVVSSDTRETVDTLLALRNFIREVARRDEIKKAVKGPGDKSEEELKPELHDFDVLADDIDMSLHDYRYRESKEIPNLKARRKGKVLKNTLSKGVRKNCVGRDLNKFMVDNKPVVVFNSSLENNYMSLRNADVEKHYPHANEHKVGDALIRNLTIGDMLAVRLEQKCVKAEVLEVVPQMKAAYISFEDYPSVYDEYQPFDMLRLPSREEIAHSNIKPGLVVLG